MEVTVKSTAYRVVMPCSSDNWAYSLLLQVSCFTYSSALKIEVICFSEILDSELYVVTTLEDDILHLCFCSECQGMHAITVVYLQTY
jgi:hypothetical protein